MIRKNLTILMLVGILTTIIVTSTYLMNASAYKPGDSAAKYNCFMADANGNYNLTAEGDLIPCEFDTGDHAWMLTSSALVLVMTPAGLAMFYAGLSRQKNAVNTLHMVFLTTGLVAVQFTLWGYSLAFGPDAGGYGFIGTLDWAGLADVVHDAPSLVYATTIPHGTFMVFQMMFAIITPALIVASEAERMKWSAYVVFVVIWATFVYDFAAHWTWSLGAGGTAVGWTGALPSLDFAGGTVIHITSGWAGLIAALMLGRRLGYGKVPMETHNVPLIVLGAALLWFGWFGFNAGSATAASSSATSAFIATQIATGTAALTWMLISWAHTGRASTIGAATGAVAGLVAITPASGFVGPMAAPIIGIAASLV